MKNKRILYIFLAFFVIVAIALLSSALFSVNNAVLSPYGDCPDIDEANAEAQLKTIYGKNIFFINETETIENIEKSNPYIKVINIERVFPSTVKLHYHQRKEVFCLEVYSGYAVIDGEGKVLDIRAQPLGGVLIDIDFTYLKPQVSDFIQDESVLNILGLFEAFRGITNPQKTYDEQLFKSYFDKVYLASAQNLVVVTVFGGEIEIVNYKSDLFRKLYIALDFFDSRLDDVERSSVTLIVDYDKVSIKT